MIFSKYFNTIQLLKQIIIFIFNNSLYFFFYRILGLKVYLIKLYLAKTGITESMLIKNLPNYKFLQLCAFINFEGKSSISYNIDQSSKFNLIKSIDVYKGVRLRNGLPLNGQRTHSNGKTAKYLLKKNNASKS